MRQPAKQRVLGKIETARDQTQTRRRRQGSATHTGHVGDPLLVRPGTGFNRARRRETAGCRPTHNHARCQTPWQTIAHKEKDPPALDRGSFSIVWSETDTSSAAPPRIAGIPREANQPIPQKKRPMQAEKVFCPLHAPAPDREPSGFSPEWRRPGWGAVINSQSPFLTWVDS